MNKILTVIFGAGASFDCRQEYHILGSRRNLFPRMPLTDGLFNIPTDVLFKELYKSIFKAYRGAEIVGNLYTTMLNAGVNQKLELFLNELTHKSPEDVLHAREVPFFIRELIGNLGNKMRETFGQTHYSTLIQFLNNAGYDKIVLISLNYDLLLDWALKDYARLPLENIQDYVEKDRKWSYVKLHGSVNWINILEKQWIGQKLIDLNCKEGSGIAGVIKIPTSDIFRPGFQYTLNEEYAFGGGGTCYYPIMVLPHAEQKKYICPESHIQAIIPYLNECEDFWIIGNSMQDGDIVSLMKENAKKVRRVMVVDEFSLIEPNYWKTRLKEAFPIYPSSIGYQKNGFHEFINNIFKNEKIDFYGEKIGRLIDFEPTEASAQTEREDV